MLSCVVLAFQFFVDEKLVLEWKERHVWYSTRRRVITGGRDNAGNPVKLSLAYQLDHCDDLIDGGVYLFTYHSTASYVCRCSVRPQRDLSPLR